MSGQLRVDEITNEDGSGSPSFPNGVDATEFIASGTGASIMPVGTTAQRPASPAAGMYRLNTTTGNPEWYDPASGTWVAFNVVIPTLTTVDGTIFAGQASTLTLTGTNFGAAAAGTVRFTSGATVADVSVTPASQTSASVTVPASIFNLSGGSVVAVQFINSGGGTSNAVNKTVTALPTGGTITTAGGFRIHTFTSSSSFVVPTGFSADVEYLVIAGGGSSGDTAVNGSNTTFGSITSTGGGAGRTGTTAGNSGGSGGGGGGSDGTQPGGAGTSGQGFSGGTGFGTAGLANNGAGGGGGAGSAGGNAPANGVGGSGGNGLQSSINGTATFRAGGGVGTGHESSGGAPGATGAGGSGKAVAGAANTGAGAGGSNAYQGGGGAGGYRCSVPGESSGGGASAESRLSVTAQTYTVTIGAGGAGSLNGGSGIVIIRYAI